MVSNESEPNDTRATADAVTLATPITGQLSSYTDVDYYAVTVGSSGMLSVVFDVPTNSSNSDYFKLGLYDGSGTLLSLFSTGVDKTYTAGVAAAGTYYIGVTGNDFLNGYYYSSGQYSLTASVTAGSANGAESEPNDTRATADAVTLATPITGQLSSYTDVDYYAVTVGSSGMLSVVFDVPTNSSSSDYFKLGLYDSGGTLLSLFSTGVDKTYTAGVAAAGTYYIGVTGNDFLNGYYYSSGQYSVTASIVAGSANGAESEPNNTISTADAMTLGTAITGQLSSYTDTDYYSVTATSAGTLSVAFDVPTNSSYSNYFKLGLYDGSGTLLSMFSTGVDKTYTAGVGAAGTYYIGVTGNDYLSGYYFNSGQYSLTASVTTGSATADDYAATTLTSGRVTSGGSVSGRIESVGDNDWFGISLTAGTRYQFSLDGSTLYDPYLSLYSSTGSLITASDDGGLGLNSLISFTASSSGTYYLGARGYGTGTGKLHADCLWHRHRRRLCSYHTDQRPRDRRGIGQREHREHERQRLVRDQSDGWHHLPVPAQRRDPDRSLPHAVQQFRHPAA